MEPSWRLLLQQMWGFGFCFRDRGVREAGKVCQFILIAAAIEKTCSMNIRIFSWPSPFHFYRFS